MMKDDPPATYQRRPSFHGAEVVADEEVERAATHHQRSLSAPVSCGTSAVLPEDCGMICDPAVVLGQLFAFGRGGKQSKLDKARADSAPESPRAPVAAASDASTSSDQSNTKQNDDDDDGVVRQKRGRFLIWPVRQG